MALPVLRHAVGDGVLLALAVAPAPANKPGLGVKRWKKARLPSAPIFASGSPPLQSYPCSVPGPKGTGAGVETPTHLKLFRVKFVDRWVLGPGSHWQVRLFVVRFMRQDRLWGVAGGSVYGVGRVRASGKTTQKAPTGTTWPRFLALGQSLVSMQGDPREAALGEAKLQARTGISTTESPTLSTLPPLTVTV